MQSPFLKAATGIPSGLLPKLRIERDIAVGGVIDEVAVWDQDAVVALPAAVRQAVGKRDPTIGACIEIVGQIVGVGTGKSRAGPVVKAAPPMSPKLPDTVRSISGVPGGQVGMAYPPSMKIKFFVISPPGKVAILPQREGENSTLKVSA